MNGNSYLKYKEKYEKIKREYEIHNKINHVLGIFMFLGIITFPSIIAFDCFSLVFKISFIVILIIIDYFAIYRKTEKFDMIENNDCEKIMDVLSEIEKYPNFFMKDGKTNYIFYVFADDELKKMTINKLNFRKMNNVIFDNNTVTFDCSRDESYINLDDFKCPVICGLKCKGKRDFLTQNLEESSKNIKKKKMLNSFRKIK